MGAVHIRNVWSYNGTGSNSQYMERVLLWMMREAFLAGRWTEVDKDVASGWASASNILLSLSDFAVTAANPYQVTSATGGFDAATHETYMLTLFAANDSIRGIYNVDHVKDSNTLYVDPRTRAGDWPVDESGITGRIHKASQGDPLSSAASYVVMQAPAASGSVMQIHFTHDSVDTLTITGYPLGDWLSAATATGSQTIVTTYNNDYGRMNWYFSDQASNLLMHHAFYEGTASANHWHDFNAGELLSTASGDTNPGFINTVDSSFDHLSNGSPMQMLNESGAPTVFYPTYYKKFSDNGDYDIRERQANAVRINGGRHKVFNPVVVGDDSSGGGFLRGIDPRTYTHYNLQAMEEFGTDWWYMTNNALVPKDGADDPRFIAYALYR
jgi:hypothetical protein